MNRHPKDAVDELMDVLVLRRRTLHLSKEDIAREIGRPGNRDYVSKCENGLIDPPARFLIAYADAVGMKLNWTLGKGTTN